MRVALVAGPDPGHLLPVAGLARRLQDVGDDVLVLSGERWLAPLTRDGVPAGVLPLLAVSPEDDNVGYRMNVRPVEMTRPTADLLAAFAPDIVVTDTLTRVGGLAAALLGVPWVEWLPHLLCDPRRGMPPFGTGWWPPRWWRDVPIRWAAERDRAAGRRLRATMAAAAGLGETEPVVRLVGTFPALEPQWPDWPADAVVVGSARWESADTDLRVPTGDAPVVMVVGSTASGQVSDLLGLSLAALDGAGVRLVSPRFGAPPSGLPSWVAAGPGRLDPLLDVASVVVSPGGHGVVSHALQRGVPLVMVPGHGDQKEIAARVARLGAGLVSAPSRLRAAVTTVLADPSFAVAARAAADRRGLPDPVDLVHAAAAAPVRGGTTV